MPIKRILSLLLILLLILTAASVGARSYELRKKAGEYETEVRLDRNPPSLGDNNIEIEIKDGEGKPLTEAKVLVNYYMPPMPRMAPMNYTSDARLKGEKYKAAMKLIMSGPWVIAVKITHGGKTSTAKFNIDAQ